MKTFNRLPLVLMGGSALFACSNAKSGPERLNIIHIMTDDHSFQTISAYGHPISQLAPTPNLDRLASEGMLFTRGYVENSLSAPSRATLLTGMYSHCHGQETLGRGLDTTLTVFPELLQEAGYQTAVVGKWHLHCDPKGFDYYKILHDQGDYYNPQFKTAETGGKYVKEQGYAPTLITDYSLEWLDNRDRSKPFCLLLHHKTPHRNWMPETKYLNLYDDVEFPYPETLFDDYEGRHAAATQEMTIAEDMSWAYDLKVDQLKELDTKLPWTNKDWARALNRMTPEEREAWNAAYDEENLRMIESNLTGEELVKWKYQRYIRDYVRCIKSLDDQIGRVLDYLEENGLAENTIVVYTSDQGFYMGEHGWFDKRFMYEESFRTPLIIRHPKMKKRGVTCDALVQNIDYAPTYMDIAGIEQPEWMVGRSLTDLILNDGKEPEDWRKTLYYHYYDYPAIHMVRRHDGVGDGRYKLIHFYGEGKNKDKGDNLDSWELFDLQNDPNEVHNIYGKPGTEEITERLKSELVRYRTDYKVTDY